MFHAQALEMTCTACNHGFYAVELNLIANPAGVSEAQIRPFAYTAAPLKKCLHSTLTPSMRPEVAR